MDFCVSLTEILWGAWGRQNKDVLILIPGICCIKCQGGIQIVGGIKDGKVILDYLSGPSVVT